MAVGDNATSTYQTLIEAADSLDQLTTLFDSSASLFKDELLDLIREQVAPTQEPVPDIIEPTEDEPEKKPQGRGTGVIPSPSKRLTKIRLRLEDLPIATTSNLQPYLFRVLQEQDAGAEPEVTIEVISGTGIPGGAGAVRCRRLRAARRVSGVGREVGHGEQYETNTKTASPRLGCSSTLSHLPVQAHPAGDLLCHKGIPVAFSGMVVFR